MNPSTTALTLNMQLPNIATVSWAVQGDQLARRITATLVDGSTPWVPDASYNGVVRYHKPDGTSGVYDVAEDGNRAVTWSGNVATITIAQQALTVPGSVSMQLEFYDTNNARLTAFGWTNNVQPSAVTDTEFISTDYYNILTLQISAVLEVAGEMTPYSSTPEMDGTGSPGTSPFYSRGNHVHPTDTSRASVEALSTYTRPNLLDNWYFVGGGSQAGNGIFPINQRGQTSYGTAQFFADRWYNGSGGTGVVITAGYLTLSSGTIIRQKIVKPFTSAKLTMSVLNLSGNLITGTAVFNGSTTPVTFATANNFQLYMADDGAGNIVFYVASLATVGMVAVKVELGDTQTLAHLENGSWVLNEVPNYIDQFAKCTKYLIHPTASARYVADWNQDNTQIRVYIPLGYNMAGNTLTTSITPSAFKDSSGSHALSNVSLSSVTADWLGVLCVFNATTTNVSPNAGGCATLNSGFISAE